MNTRKKDWISILVALVVLIISIVYTHLGGERTSFSAYGAGSYYSYGEVVKYSVGTEAEWVDKKRYDASYYTVAENQGWNGKYEWNSILRKKYVKLSTITPNGSIYVLPSVYSNEYVPARVISEYYNKFDVDDYVNTWKEIRDESPILMRKRLTDIPNDEGLREDAEFVKQKLKTLADAMSLVDNNNQQIQ